MARFAWISRSFAMSGAMPSAADPRAPSRPLRRLVLSTVGLVMALVTLAPIARAHLSIIRQGGECAGALEAGDRLGGSLAVGDFNHDGYDDLAMGTPGEDVGALADAGAVIVSFGSKYGITHVGSFAITANSIGQVSQAGAQFGFSLLSRDFNGDGFFDLVIGAPYEDVGGQSNAGRIYIVYGNAGGLNNTSVVYDQSDAGGASEGGDLFGWALASGNFDGDGGGYPDLAVGAPGENSGSGAVSINFMGSFLGLTSGIATTVMESDLGATNDAGDSFGYALAAGNLAHSNEDDLAVGAPGRDISGSSNAGRVYLLAATAAGLTTSSPLLVDASNKDTRQAGGMFGWALATGRFFSGSYLGLAVGEPGRLVSASPNAGRVIVAKGIITGLDFTGTNGRILTENSGGSGVVETNDRFGEALAAGDYYNADGYDDVGVGAPGDGLGFTFDAGQFQIFPGSATGPTGAGWSGFNQGTCNDPAETSDHFGSSVAYGHFDDTGKGGFAVGAPDEDVAGAYANPTATYINAGQVHVITPWRQVFNLTSGPGVMGACDGELLFSVRPFDQVYIASTTKTMTILLACEHIQAGLNPNTPYTIPSWVADDAKIDGSQCVPPLATGETLTLQDLMYMCLRFSGNDASFAIADILYGGGGQSNFGVFVNNVVGFVNEMNTRAASLGMSGTHFTNPPGYDWPHTWLPTGNDHRSTAYDMWLLGKAAMGNTLFRQVCGLTAYSTTRMNAPYTVQPGYAGGFNDPKVIGVKDGGTKKAKTTAVFAAQNPSGPGLVVGSLFASPTNLAHFTEPASMMNMALAQCNLPQIVFNGGFFNFTRGGFSTFNGDLRIAGGLFEPADYDDMLVELHREAGTSPASLHFELGRQTQLTLDLSPTGAPEIVPFGIAPFESHRGFVISNLDSVAHTIRVTLSNAPGYADYLVPPESLIVIPPYTAPAPLDMFEMTLQNMDGNGPTFLSVTELYAFDPMDIGPPQPEPAVTYQLRRAKFMEDAFWVSGLGRDADQGSSVAVVIRDPTGRLGVDPPGTIATKGTLRLLPPAPNPFRGGTLLPFVLSAPAHVGLTIHDVQGRLVRQFPEKWMPAGRREVTWDGAAADGTPAGSGVYFYRVTLRGGSSRSGPVVLIR